jgi:hypothetical protein
VTEQTIERLQTQSTDHPQEAERRAKAVARILLNTPPRPLRDRPKSVFSVGERSEIAGLERAAERAMKNAG